MNTHRSLGFLAALLVTVGQFFVLSTSTTAVAQNATDRAGYETTLSA
jgi:hypothetical protein